MLLERLDALHKSFDGHPVLQGVSLTIEKGEVAALIGGSGCGKSVLLKHLAGLMKPDRGRVFIDDTDMAALGGGKLQRVRARLGFLFQGGALFDSMTVFENIAFPLNEKSRLSRAVIERRVSEELGHVGLKGSEHKYPSQISGGMIKRAALARALVTEPEIMLFDEPTTGLDPVMGRSILKLITSCHERLAFTGIIVTHMIPKVFEIVDRVVLLHEGTVWANGSVEEIMNSRDPFVREFVSVQETMILFKASS